MMMMLVLFCSLLLFVSVCAIPFHNNHHGMLWRRYRGGSSSTEELTLEEKVHAAMLKLGIQPVAEESPTPPTGNAVTDSSPVLTEAVGSAPPPIVEDTATTTTTTAPPGDDAAVASSTPAPPDDPFAVAGGASCSADGVCTAPPEVVEDEEPVTATADVAAVEGAATTTEEPSTPAPPPIDEDPEAMAIRIADSMGVDPSLAWAALAATSTEPDSTGGDRRVLDETKARAMLQQEMDMVEQIPEDSAAVHQLMTEGFENRFLVRRALAFAEHSLDDARAILQAEMDEEEEEEAPEVAPSKPVSVDAGFKTVNVEAGFDPTAPPPAAEQPPPAPASRESVVFDVTTAEVFDVALQSPVPVLLDIYADWCGPCKALSPILEEMAMKSGGAFRLVKVNTDNEQAVSSALDVTSLPTIFGIRNGKIVHMFQGMPRSEEMMKNFMMGLLMPGQAFNPPVTADEQEKYDDWTRRLIKTATAASYSFGTRERLQDRTKNQLDAIVEQTGDVFDAEASAKVLRSLLSNVMQDPFATKFRSVKLDNKVIRAKIAQYPGAIAILKSVGFKKDKSDNNLLLLGDGSSKLINTAPLTAARAAIDKWIDKKRYEVARAARKRKDDADKVHVQAELEAAAKEEEKRRAEEEAEEAEAIDPNLCQLKLRLEGKKKVHSVSLDGDTPLGEVLAQLPRFSSDTECQILCVAKRLVVSSTDSDAMQQSLRDHGLFPTASLVIKPSTAAHADAVGTTPEKPKPSLAERAAARRKLKRGSHTMQSIGIYAKDDNAKGELIDGGGGVMYEQDVSDDEEEEVAPEKSDDAGNNESGSSDTEAADDEADT